MLSFSLSVYQLLETVWKFYESTLFRSMDASFGKSIMSGYCCKRWSSYGNMRHLPDTTVVSYGAVMTVIVRPCGKQLTELYQLFGINGYASSLNGAPCSRLYPNIGCTSIRIYNTNDYLLLQCSLLL